MSLDRIFEGAKVYFADAVTTPAGADLDLSPHDGPDATWSTGEWKELSFEMREHHYFVYEYGRPDATVAKDAHPTSPPPDKPPAALPKPE